MPRNDKERITFQGFKGPNYTIVPDELFDQLMVDLSGAELKALLYIVRRTFGFKRNSDNISLSQMLNGIQTRDGRTLDRGVGLSKKTLLQALNSLEERNIILTQRRQSAERGNEPTSYRLNVLEPIVREETTPPLGEKLRQGVGGEIPPRARGKNSPTQDTVNQETGIHNSNIRKASARGEEGGGRSDPSADASDASGAYHITPLPTGSPAATATEPEDTPPAARNGLEPIGTTLARRGPRPRGERTPDDADRPLIVAYLEDFAREFRDQAPLKHSVSRALNLYHRSGRSREVFIAAMYQARARTKEATKVQHRMAYWFRCLEDALGLKEAPGPGETAP